MQDMVRITQRRMAVRAPDRLGTDNLVRCRGQRPSPAHAPQAARARALALALLRSVRLLAP